MPEDTANYQTVEVDISIEVVPAVTPVNHVPVITAEDRTLTVGRCLQPVGRSNGSRYGRRRPYGKD